MKKTTLLFTAITFFVNGFSQTPCSPAGLPSSLQAGLVAYYPFCNNANDQSGNSFNATVFGSIITADRFGTPNSAYSFNGVSNYMLLGSSFDLLPRSVCFWFNASTIDATGRFVYCSDNNSLVNGLTNFGVVIDNGADSWWSTVSNVTYFDSITPNVWHHAVVTVDSNVVRRYIDGQPVASDSVFSFLSSASGNNFAVVGASRFTTNGLFEGIIDDIMIYSRVLTPTEATLIYSNNPASVSSLAQNTVSISPNPATSELRIQNAEFKIEEIEIYNMLGMRIFSQNQEARAGNQVVTDVSSLKPGIYFVRAKTRDGINSAKFVKE